MSRTFSRIPEILRPHRQLVGGSLQEIRVHDFFDIRDHCIIVFICHYFWTLVACLDKCNIYFQILPKQNLIHKSRDIHPEDVYILYDVKSLQIPWKVKPKTFHIVQRI